MKKQDRPYKVIISGGGTGGHVFPAIAIANKFKEMYPQTDIYFVGAKGRLEMEKVPEAGYPIKGLWISGFQRSLSLKNLSFPFKVISSLYQSGKILKSFQPDIAIGVGGYASGPLLYTASGKHIPILIQEQNSYPGITNRILAKRAEKICVAYDQMNRYFPESKIVKTGNPVRSLICNMDLDKGKAISEFGLKQGVKTILVIGGSLGARMINNSIQKDLDKILGQGFNLIWQTGKAYFEALKHLQKGREGQLKIMPFIKEMDWAYSAADLIISRAGAIAVSELCVVGKPVILVPSPNVAEDHQTKNAMALVQKEAGILVKDREAMELLADQAIYILQHDALGMKLSQNIKALAVTDAARRIVEEAKALIEKWKN
jgi:UDP-N-acetylglucosamine--N-acetylmuramyl-(pentapeptide) pyrophosphoryl-undecaprenol N-acetylglucosamine transferase